MKMPLITLAAAVGTLLAFQAGAAGSHADHGAMHGAASADKSAASVPMADAVVKKVDKAGGKLTLSHGPLPNGMPAMTMAFRVKDAAWLDQLKAGDRVRFTAEQVDGLMTVQRLERN